MGQCHHTLHQMLHPPMRFLHPRTDFAFKKIFGSQESTDILVSFLNAILGLKSPYRIERA